MNDRLRVYPRYTLPAPISRRTALKAVVGTTLAALGGASGAAATVGNGDVGWTPLDHRRLASLREPSTVKAAYMNPLAVDDWAGFIRLVEMIDRTELNALVIDVKEDAVYFRTRVSFFRELGVVSPRYDLTDILDVLHERGIYAIARLVVFKDSRIAEARPDLAVKDRTTGGLWRDMNGVAWVNAFERELWEANADLALDAARFGFDEIQYDYVRFPTDGNLRTMDFGQPYDADSRSDAIIDFLRMSKRRLQGTGAKLAADVFGYTLLDGGDLGIGQDIERITRAVDVVCPMVYPSHWPNGSLAVGGHPNNYPYETIAITMDIAADRLGRQATKVRPWLQDFSLAGLSAYGVDQVRAQIDAVAESEVRGWMMWNAASQYHEGAFKAAG